MYPYSQLKRHKQEENHEGWLMSYADLITLLLCFFVIFVSTSEPRKDQLAAATRGMQARFGTVDLSTPFDGALRALQGVIDENKAFRSLAVEKTERGLIMELSTDTFFVQNTAELIPAQATLLKEIIDNLNIPSFKSYAIVIAAHTDDKPFTDSSAFKNAWDLSAAQAARLARAFETHGVDPARLQVAAYGAQKSKVPNVDSSGNAVSENQARNRRIVISLERPL